MKTYVLTEKKNMERCSTSSIIRKLQMKTTIRGITGLLEWPKSRTLAISNAGKDVEQQEFCSLLVGMQNGAVTLENSLKVSYKVTHALTT